MYKFDIKGSDGHMVNPIFLKNVQWQRHPRRWGIAESRKSCMQMVFRSIPWTLNYNHCQLCLICHYEKLQFRSTWPKKIIFTRGSCCIGNFACGIIQICDLTVRGSTSGHNCISFTQIIIFIGLTAALNSQNNFCKDSVMNLYLLNKDVDPPAPLTVKTK